MRHPRANRHAAVPDGVAHERVPMIALYDSRLPTPDSAAFDPTGQRC
jgi:hypothetical protein